MSISIQVNQSQVNKDEKLQLHFLPAKIDGEGSANVDKFFNNYTREDNNILSNSLRGYPLKGVTLNVPESFKGLVVQEKQVASEAEERILRITGNFDKFTYWNYDKMPSKGDAYVQALAWTDIATELAKPISEADVLGEMEALQKETD